jgi:hypothetical protein
MEMGTSINDASDEVNTKNKVGPPVTGKHFYANFRNEFETGVFYIDVLVHDTKFELDLWVTSAEPNMALISQDGPSNMFFVKKRYSKLESKFAVSDQSLKKIQSEKIMVFENPTLKPH